MVFCTAWYDRLQGPFVPDAEATLPAKTLLDGSQARVHVALNDQGEPTGLVRLTLVSAVGRPAIKNISVQFGHQKSHQPIRRMGNTIEARAWYDPTLFKTGAPLSFAVFYLNDQDDHLTWTEGF